MELQTARHIVDTLARGIHPDTGEAMPPDSPYNAPDVIRALYVVSRALEEPPPERKKREGLPNAGKPWSEEDDAMIAAKFDEGVEAKEIAREIGRTVFAVETRLMKLGKIPARVGRYG